MNLTKSFLILLSLTFSGLAFSRGGDDAGNGGFAYKQSIIILERATEELEHKIIESDLEELRTHPEWRKILLNTLSYDALNKQPKKNAYRGGRKLAMNYQVNPPLVSILKPYYEAFMGKLDSEIEASELEVEKRLLHEASHIWGYKEVDSAAFALRFLNEARADETRPTNQIEIKPDFCSCLNGKSDLINDCDVFCSLKPVTKSPILYLNTILGPEITLNSKLGNLYNWCNVQLQGDITSPQCFLNATDGDDEVNIPVTINSTSNSLTANLQALSFDRTYLLKIMETKTGSNAQSKEFQLRRKKQEYIPPTTLKISAISQYTCIVFGGKVLNNGDVIRDSYARFFYSFAEGETPAPMPPTRNEYSPVVCHDEQLYPGNDSPMYQRLELVPQHWSAWDKSDPRFILENGQKLKINMLIEERLLNEYNISANIDLFSLVRFPNRPNVSAPLGYILKPFVNQLGKSDCPGGNGNNENDPLFNILGDYLGNSEGLYLAEKEAEIISDGNGIKTIYGTMFVTESMIKKYGFYLENGLKIKVTPSSLHTKTIFYYWPFNDQIDPLTQGSRKLFTVMAPYQLNGHSPDGVDFPRTSDKRIGCIPKGAL